MQSSSLNMQIYCTIISVLKYRGIFQVYNNTCNLLNMYLTSQIWTKFYFSRSCLGHVTDNDSEMQYMYIYLVTA